VKALKTLLLDIKGAYDTVRPNILFNIINSMKIPIHYKNFVQNLINYRMVNFYESGFYGSCFIYEGLPQGSTLNPLLFNL